MMDGMAASFVSILYAEDFDDPDLASTPDLPSVPDAAPAPPKFTQADLEAAQQIARVDAVQAAKAEWERSALHDRTQSLAAIAMAVADAQQEARSLADTVADGTARAILSMMASQLPSLCAQHGGAEVRALLRHLLPTLAQQPRITVRVAPAMLDGVRSDLLLLDEELVAAIELTAAPISPGDARVTWTDGSLVRDQATIHLAMTAALVELGLLAPVTTRVNQRSMALAE